MPFTDRRNKLLTYIKMKRSTLVCSHYRVQIRCFTRDLFLIKKRTCSSHKSSYVHKPFPFKIRQK